jgi:hypothetical protein
MVIIYGFNIDKDVNNGGKQKTINPRYQSDGFILVTNSARLLD